MHLLPQQTALIVIDVQQGLDDPSLGERNNPQAEANMVRLLNAWRRDGRPIIHVRHDSTEPQSPLRPELPGNAIKPEVQPQGDEPLITKNVNSAFVGTDLEARLRAQKIQDVVIIGLTTPYCVSTTARMAANLGFKTIVVSDATASHAANGPDGQPYSAQQVHDMALVNLNGEFATIVTTNEVLTSGHIA
jgi:nicotinamidase-related amidase